MRRKGYHKATTRDDIMNSMAASQTKTNIRITFDFLPLLDAYEVHVTTLANKYDRKELASFITFLTNQISEYDKWVSFSHWGSISTTVIVEFPKWRQDARKILQAATIRLNSIMARL